MGRVAGESAYDMNNSMVSTNHPGNRKTSVRLLTCDKLETAVALFVAQLTEHSIAADADSVRGILGQYLTDSRHGFVLVAESDEMDLVGVALCSSFLGVEHRGPSGWLEELYVCPGSRGRGIGTLLLTRAISEAGRRGWRALDLEVEADHREVIPLYERHGFKPKTRSGYCLKLTSNPSQSTQTVTL